MTQPAPPVDPAAEALTSAARANRLLSRPVDDDSDALLSEVVEAVNSLVPTWLVEPANGWAAHHHLGATMLAVRLYRRKDSPGGLAQFGMEGAAYVAGNWPDVAMLLGLGNYAVGRPG
jgi:hypothetical protein